MEMKDKKQGPTYKERSTKVKKKHAPRTLLPSRTSRYKIHLLDIKHVLE
jgi:hypothetical protein